MLTQIVPQHACHVGVELKLCAKLAHRPLEPGEQLLARRVALAHICPEHFGSQLCLNPHQLADEECFELTRWAAGSDSDEILHRMLQKIPEEPIGATDRRDIHEAIAPVMLHMATQLLEQMRFAGTRLTG